ncbi:Asp23/Gls24 family envelope stress response protein, partial [Streptomyces sp. SID2119]|nr:Asp23/Gls24 family envelope stress response protein [Streptomyces sp. SID2119]
MAADTPRVRDRLAEAAARAAQDVPGVAFLRPGV